MDRLLSTAETAELLGVSENALRIWRHRNEGPAHAKYGRQVMYRPADVEAWVESKTVQPGSALSA